MVIPVQFESIEEIRAIQRLTQASQAKTSPSRLK